MTSSTGNLTPISQIRSMAFTRLNAVVTEPIARTILLSIQLTPWVPHPEDSNKLAYYEKEGIKVTITEGKTTSTVTAICDNLEKEINAAISQIAFQILGVQIKVSIFKNFCIDMTEEGFGLPFDQIKTLMVTTYPITANDVQNGFDNPDQTFELDLGEFS